MAVPPLGRTRERAAQPITIVRPIVSQLRVGAEPLDEEFVLFHREDRLAGNDRSRRGADDHFSPAMLPLVSTTKPRLTGTRSALEVRDLDRLVVLVDDEVFLPEFGTKRPERSVTVTLTLISSTPLLNRKPS